VDGRVQQSVRGAAEAISCRLWQQPGAGCPISRVLCEKWGFSLTPPNRRPELRRILSFHDGNRGLTELTVPGLPPQCEVTSVTDEHWLGLGSS